MSDFEELCKKLALFMKKSMSMATVVLFILTVYSVFSDNQPGLPKEIYIVGAAFILLTPVMRILFLFWYSFRGGRKYFALASFLSLFVLLGSLVSFIFLG